MPIEVLYLWGVMLVVIVATAVLVRWLRRRRIEGRLWPWQKIKSVALTGWGGQRTRCFWLLLAVVYVGPGVYLLAQRETLFGDYVLVERWNKRIHFDLLNVSNAAAAVLFMMMGGFIFAGVGRYEPRFEGRPLPEWRPLPMLGGWREGVGSWLTAVFLLAVMSWQLLHQDTSFFPVLLWLIFTGGASWKIWRWEKGDGIDLSLGWRRIDGVWLLVILIIGFSVASAYLLDIPAKIVGDEGAFWETARRISVGEYEPSFFGLGVYTFPIASSFFQAWVLRLFGATIWSWRFASVAAGVLGTIPLYLLTKEWFDRRTAVIAAFIMLVTPYFLAFARMGYNNSQALFPVTFCLYFMTLALKRASYFYAWLAGLAAAAGFYTYSAAQLGLVVAVFVVVYLAVTRRLSWPGLARLGGTIVWGWFLFRLPLFIYDVANPDGATPYKIWESMFFNVFYGREFFADTELFRLADPILIGSQELFFEPFIYIRLLLRGIVRSLLVFPAPLGRIGEHFLESGLAGGMTASIFLVFGSAVAVRERRRLRFALLLLWFGSGLVLLSMINTFPPRHAHLVSILPAMVILIAVGLIAFAEAFVAVITSIHRVAKPERLIWLIVVIALTSISYAGMVAYFGKIAEAYPSDFDQMVTWTAVRLEQPGDVVLVEVTGEQRAHGTAYLVGVKALALDYRILDATALQEGVTVLPESANMVVFVPYESAVGVLTKIVEQMENAASPISFGGMPNRPWGYVITNRDMDFKLSMTVYGAIHSLIAFPVWPVLLFLFLLLAFLLRPYRTLFRRARTDN